MKVFLDRVFATRDLRLKKSGRRCFHCGRVTENGGNKCAGSAALECYLDLEGTCDH